MLQRLALNVLHNEIVMVDLTQAIVYPHDAIMVQTCERLSLAVESVGGSLFFSWIRELISNFGDGAGTIVQSLVLGEIDLLHSSTTDPLYYAVPASENFSLTQHGREGFLSIVGCGSCGLLN